MKITPLNWTEDFDERDNSIWEAASPYGDGPEGDPLDPFYFRIKQRLIANQIEWFDASDTECLLDDLETKTWPTLEQAKADFEAANAEIQKEESK